VLRNLLSNADKYSPSDAPIGVRVRNTGSEVVISVSDEGPGVALEELDLIFERFYRAPGSGKNGTGIGLTVCKRLIEAQSGRIWAQRRDRGGLEVSFTLPIYSETSLEPVN
jgi:two-component system sensor histidine kinase KdpD